MSLNILSWKKVLLCVHSCCGKGFHHLVSSKSLASYVLLQVRKKLKGREGLLMVMSHQNCLWMQTHSTQPRNCSKWHTVFFIQRRTWESVICFSPRGETFHNKVAEHTIWFLPGGNIQTDSTIQQAFKLIWKLLKADTEITMLHGLCCTALIFNSINSIKILNNEYMQLLTQLLVSFVILL